ncbi:MAG TPA: hypothetical protein V6C89_20325 [Drouetiella sp.]|jgi:hypothetical protein
MHDSNQVRELFRKMADGLVLNYDNQRRSKLGTKEDCRAQDPNSDVPVKFADFGVGLPPLAQV